MARIIETLAADWGRLDERVEEVSTEIEMLARKEAPCQRLMTVPGIGPLISSATVATIGAGHLFSKGRDFSAWLGIVPKQLSTRGAPSWAKSPNVETSICACCSNCSPLFDGC